MTIGHALLQATRYAAIFAGTAAVGMICALIVANWKRSKEAFARQIVLPVCLGVLGMIMRDVYLIVELVLYDAPFRWIGGPTFLVLFTLLDVGLYRAVMKTYLYALLMGAGAISTTAVLRLKGVADNEHAALQAQIDKIVETLERGGKIGG